MDDGISEQQLSREAHRIFSENMLKYRCSYTPSGIAKAAIAANGEIYGNWETRMRMHRPSAAEHPRLYTAPRFLNKNNKNN